MSRQIIIKDILSLDELQSRTTPTDWDYSVRYTSVKRRCEWLSWRCFLREELGADCQIEYTDLGAPCIVGSTLFLSISHTRNSVAILLSDSACGIDIELKSRRFSTIAGRYLTSAERDIISADSVPMALAIAWSAKEAAYKYSADSALDMLRDITIISIDYSARLIQIQVKSNIIEAAFFDSEDYVVVVI